MKAKLILLLLIGVYLNVVLLLINGCRPKKGPECSTITSITFTAFNNADSLPRQAANGEHVPAAGLLLQLNTFDSIYSCSRFRLDPITTASAEYFPRVRYDTLDTVFIVCDKDFDRQHPAGTDLYALFSIPDSTAGANHYLKNKYYLRSAPDDSGLYTFSLTVRLNHNKKTLTANTVPVYLVK